MEEWANLTLAIGLASLEATAFHRRLGKQPCGSRYLLDLIQPVVQIIRNIYHQFIQGRGPCITAVHVHPDVTE